MTEGPGFRVDRSAFVDPDVFRAERLRIFGYDWLYVGHASEVAEAGTVLPRTVGGRPVLLVNDGGTPRVLQNVCLHRGVPLCEVPGKARTLVCPYHGWAYRLDGQLARLPGRGDGPLPELSVGLPTRAHGDWIFTCYAQDPPPFDLASVAPWLALVDDQGPDGMEVVPGVQQYRVHANWKLLVDNGLDAAHVGSLHRRFLADLRGAGVALTGAAEEAGSAVGLGDGHAAVEFPGPWGRPMAHWSPELGEAARAPVEAVRAERFAALGPDRATRICDLSRMILVWPNVLVNDLPALTIRQLEPVGPSETLVSAWALAPRGEHPDLRAARLDAFNRFFGPAGFAHADDLRVSEGIQASLAAGGTNAYDRSGGAAGEDAMRGFWRHWAARVDP
ncbi:MAG: Rieske 2Fe-2S domain-containing protein [Alphaproteobacteria bacterium]|nr:Rieske 2Fe-2S domain-containing protein [Alphaproteobacteria bacterium]